MFGQLHADTTGVSVNGNEQWTRGMVHAPGSVAMRASAAAWPAKSRVTAVKRRVLKLTSMMRMRVSS